MRIRVLVALPSSQAIEAGVAIARLTGNLADVDSFSVGFLRGGSDYSVACWCMESETYDGFAHLRDAFPDAVVDVWPDSESIDPVERLSSLGIERPYVPLTPIG